MTSPTPTRRAPCPTTMAITACRSAPSAIRTAISFWRCPVVKARGRRGRSTRGAARLRRTRRRAACGSLRRDDIAQLLIHRLNGLDRQRRIELRDFAPDERREGARSASARTATFRSRPNWFDAPSRKKSGSCRNGSYAWTVVRPLPARRRHYESHQRWSARAGSRRRPTSAVSLRIRSGQASLASSSLTITTWRFCACSSSVKYRPCLSGMPSVSKYGPSTQLRFVVRRSLRSRPLPPVRRPEPRRKSAAGPWQGQPVAHQEPLRDHCGATHESSYAGRGRVEGARQRHRRGEPGLVESNVGRHERGETADEESRANEENRGEAHRQHHQAALQSRLAETRARSRRALTQRVHRMRRSSVGTGTSAKMMAVVRQIAPVKKSTR